VADGDSKRPRRRPGNNGDKNEPRALPTKIVQPHGGALNSGGTPGNKGGTGRPPNEIRALARDLGYRSMKIIEKEIERLEKLVQDGKPLPINLVLQISDQANKYGLGERVENLYPQGVPFIGELSALSEEELDARLDAASQSGEA